MKLVLSLSTTALLPMGALTSVSAEDFSPAGHVDPPCSDATPTCNASEIGPTYYDCRSHSNGCCSVTYYYYTCLDGSKELYQRAVNHQSLTCIKDSGDTYHLGHCG